MRDILIHIIGLGICDSFQADVSIFNSSFDKIFEGKTFDGNVLVSLETDCIYLVSVCSFRGVFQVVFYVDCKRNCYCFSYPMSRVITFQLTDANYDNLPIERGEIIFE